MPIAALALRTHVQQFTTQVETAAREFLVRTAREGHARIMQQQPDSTWIAFGDVAGQPWEAARRQITFKYTPGIRAIVVAIIKWLEDASPVDSGRYRRSHTLFVDHLPASPGAVIRPGAHVMIANTVPYARRLEVGKTEAGRAFLISKPNRIYERTARLASRRYTTTAISFGYTDIPDAYEIKATRRSSGRRRQRQRRYKTGDRVRSPAILIGAAAAA